MVFTFCSRSDRESVHEFVITTKRKLSANDQESAQVEHQVEHQATNQVTNQVANQVTNQVKTSKPQLSKSQKDLVNYCSVPRAAKEISDRLMLSTYFSIRQFGHNLFSIFKDLIFFNFQSSKIFLYFCSKIMLYGTAECRISLSGVASQN